MFLVVTLHVFVCLMLILIVLLQSGKSGMGATFGGSSETVFGTSGGNILAKFTAAAAVIFMFTSIGLTILTAKRSEQSVIPKAGVSKTEKGTAQKAQPKPKASPVKKK